MSIKNMTKLFICTLLSGILLIVLCSCNFHIIPDEERILTDLEEISPVLSAYFPDSSIEITKRQTNQGEKTDRIWVKLYGTNDATAYKAEYYLLYISYNDGWLLEEYDLISQDFVPLRQKAHSLNSLLPHIQEIDSIFAIHTFSKINGNIREYTDEDSELNYVTVNISAANDVLSYDAEYDLSFHWHVTDGWTLRSCEKTASKVTPLISCNKQIADDFVKGNYLNYTFVEETTASNSHYYAYNVTYNEGFLKFTDQITIMCSFNHEDLWHISHVHTADKISVEWDIIGEWTDYSGDDHIYINILSMDSESVTLEYEMQFSDYGTWDENGNIKSNGIETLKWKWYQKGNMQIAEPYSIYIDRGGSKTPIWVDGYRGVNWLGTSLTRNPHSTSKPETNPETETNAKLPGSALELLTSIWDAYDSNEKFYAFGGDIEHYVDNAPGVYDKNLVSELLVPADLAADIADTASLKHGISDVIFTCSVFHLADDVNIEAFASEMKSSIQNNQWMFGTPQKMIIVIFGDDLVLTAYGAEESIGVLQSKVSTIYPNATVLFEGAIPGK